MNNQEPEKQLLSSAAGALEVHSIFYSIQGEGPFVGRPAVFIRLAGCNLACPKCDTDYTSKRKNVSVDLIIHAVSLANKATTKPLVVITGGEPFRQDLAPLVKALASLRYQIQIETNGTLAPIKTDSFPFHLVTIVCSPKTPSIHSAIDGNARAFKYVISADSLASDGLPISSMGQVGVPARPAGHWLLAWPSIFVQPLDEGDEVKNRLNVEAAIEVCMQHGYTLCVQIHKLYALE